MKSAIIGFTGFVGGNIDDQYSFTHKYNSKNIHDIIDESFDLVVCAGIYAVKWWANQNPEEDRKQIDMLLDKLDTIEAKKFVLISTIDVYPQTENVDESTDLDNVENHVYGKNRLYVENFIKNRFSESIIVRLPGLFGKGLKKNVIYDLLNDNYLENINPNCSFQYYNLDNIWKDIQIALDHNVSTINFVTEPIKTGEIIDNFFPGKEHGRKMGNELHYDIKSVHDITFGGKDGYLYDKQTVMNDLSNFITDSRN